MVEERRIKEEKRKIGDWKKKKKRNDGNERERENIGDNKEKIERCNNVVEIGIIGKKKKGKMRMDNGDEEVIKKKLGKKLIEIEIDRDGWKMERERGYENNEKNDKKDLKWFGGIKWKIEELIRRWEKRKMDRIIEKRE